MSLLKLIRSYYFFKTLIQSFYIALSHIIIRKRETKRLTAPLMVNTSLYGWSFHIWLVYRNQ